MQNDQIGSHAVVVNGYGNGEALFVDPARGVQRRAPEGDFLRAWEDQGAESLVVLPPTNGLTGQGR